MSAARGEAVRAIVEKTGKTPEQAEAFLDLVGSAFRRRGWVDGEPMTQDQIGERLDVFLGTEVAE